MPAAISHRETCTSCLQKKTPEDFYKSKLAVSGRVSVCKDCKKRANRAWAASPAGRASLNAAKKRYDATEKGRANGRAYQAEYRKTDAGKAAYARGERKRDPVKVAARKKVYFAIKRGHLERQPCSVCKAPKGHAHHQDYGRPLDVIWLCRPCHDRLHREGQHG